MNAWVTARIVEDVRSIFGTDSVRIEYLGSGVWNDAFLVDLPDRKKAVYRVHRLDRHEEAAREWRLLEVIAETLGDRYLLPRTMGLGKFGLASEFVDARIVTPDFARALKGEGIDIGRKLGEMIRDIQAIPLEKIEPFMPERQTGFGFFREVAEAMELFRERIPDDALGAGRAMFAEAFRHPERSFPDFDARRLSHFDIHNGHIFYDRATDRVGLIDFWNARVAHPLFDFRYLYKDYPEIFADVLAWAGRGPLSEGEMRVFDALTAFNCFNDAKSYLDRADAVSAERMVEKFFRVYLARWQGNGYAWYSPEERERFFR